MTQLWQFTSIKKDKRDNFLHKLNICFCQIDIPWNINYPLGSQSQLTIMETWHVRTLFVLFSLNCNHGNDVQMSKLLRWLDISCPLKIGKFITIYKTWFELYNMFYIMLFKCGLFCRKRLVNNDLKFVDILLSDYVIYKMTELGQHSQ